MAVVENENNQVNLAQVFEHHNNQLHNLPHTSHIHQPCIPNQHYTCCGVQSNYQQQQQQPPQVDPQYTIPCCCWQHANKMNQSLPTHPIQAGESRSNVGCSTNCYQCSYAINAATQNQLNNVENPTEYHVPVELAVSQNNACSCSNCQNSMTAPQLDIHLNDNNVSNVPCNSEMCTAGTVNMSEKYPVDSQINQPFEMQSSPCTQQNQPASQNFQTPLSTIMENNPRVPIEIIPMTQAYHQRSCTNLIEPAGHCHHLNPVPQIVPSIASMSYPPQVDNRPTTPITYPVPTYQKLGRSPCNGLPTGYGRLRTLRMARLSPTHTQSGEFVQSTSHPIRHMGSAPNMTLTDPIVKNYDEMQRLHTERQQNFLQQFSTEYREGRFVDKSNGLDQLDGTRLRFNRNPAEPFNANATVIFV